MSFLFLFFVAQPTLSSRIMTGLFDDTFSGIYRLSPFDWALLIPYFGILTILSVYGLHRYATMRTYRKFRQQLPTAPPSEYAQWPKVTVQLPLYNERYVVERLLEEVCKLDYPRELLQIQVLDDSTDETHPFTQRLCNEYVAAGFPVEYRHRTNRHGYKAGALQEGLETATGELIAIFDADFIPPTDFLKRTIHFFTDAAVGVVQTRWTYLNREFNILTQVEAMLLDAHFVLEHGARCGSGLFFNFNGTAGVLRRAMIDDAGGWQHETLTEDSDLELSRATQRLALRVRQRRRVPFGTAGGNVWLPGAAGALGQRAHAGLQKTTPAHPESRPAVSRQARSLHAPDAEH